MKFVILHGTGGSSRGNWFPWLKNELGKQGHKVWTPDLPDADKPNTEKWTEYFHANIPFPYDQETILIGHSAGAVAALHILQNLEETIAGAILVGAFNYPLDREDLTELFIEPLDFGAIKANASKILFLHSDDDPNCPLEGAQDLAKRTNAKIVVLPGLKHFSYRDDPRFLELPEILPLIKEFQA